MNPSFKKVPKKYQPKGFAILFEDRDLLIGNKSPGFLTVAAKWERENSIHQILNQYVRKGDPRSHKCAYVVHRLDQATSGVLIFAKSEVVQFFLKDNWPSTVKTYYAIAHGLLAKKSGIISSYLQEDEDYVMHSNAAGEGKMARTEYEVLKESGQMSLLKINLLTGRKNQIRVHLADLGHPVVGDAKYGTSTTKFRNLALHSSTIEFTHPHRKERMTIKAEVPPYFKTLLHYNY